MLLVNFGHRLLLLASAAVVMSIWRSHCLLMVILRHCLLWRYLHTVVRYLRLHLLKSCTLLWLLLEWGWVAVYHCPRDRVLVVLVVAWRCDVSWLARPKIEQVVLTNVRVPMRVLLWWCDHHRAPVLSNDSFGRPILKLIRVIGWVSSKSVLDSIDELRISSRTSSRPTNLTITSNIWTLSDAWIFRSTSKTVFPILESLFESIIITKLVDNNSTEHRLHQSIGFKNVERRVVLHMVFAYLFILSGISVWFWVCLI